MARAVSADRGAAARPAQVKVKGSWWRHWTLRKAIGLLLAVVGGIVVLGAVAVVMTYEKTPIPTSALEATGFSQSVVYSKNGTLIGRFGSTNRKLVTYADLSRTTRDRQRGARRRGPELLQRGRRLAHRHHAGRLRGRHRRRRLAAGRLDHHPGVRPAVLQRHRHPADDEPQDQGDLRGHEGGQGEVQAVDPHQLPEHDLLRRRGLRSPGGGPDVLRQDGGQAHRGAGRGDRRDHPAAEQLPAAAVPRPAGEPLALRAQRHGADGQADRSSRRTR